MTATTRFTVALDLAKHTHVATIFDSHSGQADETTTIAITKQGFADFEKLLTSYSGDPHDFLIGCEATGHYGETLLWRLQKDGYPIVRLNPSQVVQFRRGLGRRAKTDALDADAMARQLSVMTPVPEVRLDDTALRLQRLTRLRLDFVEEQNRWISRARALLNQICPEIEAFFKDLTASSSLKLLTRYPSRRDLAEAPLDEMTEIARKSSHGVRNRDFAKQLQTLARSSVGLDDPWLGDELRIVLRQLSGIVDTVKQLECAISSSTDEYLMRHSKMSGLARPLTRDDFPLQSDLSLGTLLGEIGTIQRFASLKHLLSFFGWCPQTQESGTTSNPHPAMSPRGNRFARRILFMQAICAVRCVPEYHDYFAARVSAGKSKMKTLIAVARKILSAIFAILRTGQPYDRQQYMKHKPLAT